jgi:hypothetical protein
MKEQIKREESVHGKHWSSLHGGYFSDPVVAAPLVRKVQELADKSRADTIIDLGGGIGSVLSLLLAEGVDREVSLVNLDASDIQLGATTRTGLSCVHGSVDSFSRRDVGHEEGRFLFMMRSVLHYFGEEGLRPALRHLRAQTLPGEFFVHQTASFLRRQDADCLNDLYKIMRTKKWYPTVDFLCECLRAEGWHVLEVLPGLALPLTNEALMQRYDLSRTELMSISDQLSQNPFVSEDVFKKTDDGFCAFLHYWIYVCAPAISDKSEKDKPKKAELSVVQRRGKPRAL